MKTLTRTLGQALAPIACGLALLVACPRTGRADPTSPISPPTPSAALAEQRAPEPPSASTLRYRLGASAVGIGALTIVVGSVLGVRAIVDKSHIGSDCDRFARCNLAGYTLGSEAKDFAAVSTVMFVTGLTFEAIGIPLLISARVPKPLRPPVVTARLRVGPSGLSIVGAW